MSEKEVLLKQVLYRSIHRGCKETDFLIGEFAKKNIENFEIEKLKLFKCLIEEDDLAIYDWILSKANIPQKYQGLIFEMREFHRL